MFDDYDDGIQMFPSSQVRINSGAEDDSFKTMNDAVWGYTVVLESMLQRLVDTSYFQRLRDLKQLGASYYVFPGASHNRFEHSLGTCHLAGQMMLNLAARQPELGINPRHILLVKMAGLCHDMGHGPFSHVFDHEVLPRLASSKGVTVNWKHEDGSELMFDAAVEEGGLNDSERCEMPLSKDEIDQVKKLINPERYYSKEQLRGTENLPGSLLPLYMYEVVSNSRCSIDVDKFDYQCRDSRCCGINVAFDPRRLLRTCRVVNNQICYPVKERYSVGELFQSRYSMFKQVYSHRVAKAVELMICDALILADEQFNFLDAIKSKETYLGLTDCILREIERSTSMTENMVKSREIVKKLRCRKLYKLAGETLVGVASSKMPTVAELVAYQGNDCAVQFTESDVIVSKLVLNYAMKNEDPLSYVSFFTKEDGEYRIRKIEKQQQYSLVQPGNFQEEYIRVYVRDETHFDVVKAAFNKYVKQVHNAENTLAVTVKDNKLARSTLSFSIESSSIGEREILSSQRLPSTASQVVMNNTSAPSTPQHLKRSHTTIVSDTPDSKKPKQLSQRTVNSYFNKK